MKTILIIEDESALQKTIGDALSQEGFQTLSALDGEAGLRVAAAKLPDLILLDLILPKVNGFEVLKSLKENKETEDIPVIVLTNLEGIADIQKTLDLGAMTYLVKSSYTLQELVQKVQQAVNF